MYDISEIMQIKDIINLIQTNNFVIYGNGYVGKRFQKQIMRLGCSDHIAAIAVTNIESNIHDWQIKCISDIPKEQLVFIAAHDAVASEMKNYLDNAGFKNYVWIYPYLFEMELGFPIKKNVPIGVNELLAEIRDVYMPAIYYLSMKDYCNNNIYNGDFYIRMSTYYTTLRTGEKRWARFRDAIDKCKKVGFSQDFSLKVDEKYFLIDGLHRLVMAKYFGKDELLCDVYQCDEKFYSTKGLGGDIRISEDELKNCYSAEEIKIIKEADIELRK